MRLSIIVGDNLWRRHGGNAPPEADNAAQPLQSDTQVWPTLPDKPSIAVLAFDNLSGDREQEYFADGVADDVVTELSHDRSLFVIARNSSFTYRGHAVEVKRIARELGVRYVLEGSVRREAAHVRVNAQLIDAATGSHIWADRYDRVMEDVFAVQDEIVSAVARAVRPALMSAEKLRASRKRPESLDAWEAYQRARWHMGQHTPAENEKALSFLRRAIELDPMLSAAYVSLTIASLHFSVYMKRPITIDDILKAEPLARKAVSVDPENVDAQAVLAWVMTGSVDKQDEAWERISSVLNTGTNSYIVMFAAGVNRVWSGHPALGRKFLEEGVRISPRDPFNPILVSVIVMSHYLDHDYGAAVKAARRAIAEWPQTPLFHRSLAVALGQLGQSEEARKALRAAYASAPGLVETFTRGKPSFVRDKDYQHILEGLRKAGPDG